MLTGEMLLEVRSGKTGVLSCARIKWKPEPPLKMSAEGTQIHHPPCQGLRLALSIAITFFYFFNFFFQASAKQQTASRSGRIEGVVRDATGAVIAGGEVTLRSGAFTAVRTTNGNGEFVFDAIASETGSLIVRAPGFAPLEREWRLPDNGVVHLEIALAPESVSERINVTATRTETRMGDTPASLVVLSQEELSTTAALTIDDALRQVPGFSLFRRSGSRTANPTSQGASLRGLGASGTSRAVVLVDGVPLNDPFGGWIYWDRVPLASVSAMEVLQGGASGLYGTGALGGVVQIRTRALDEPALSVRTSLGKEQTPDISLFGTHHVGKWAGAIAGEVFHTGGYILVGERTRGRIDTPAGSEHANVDLTGERLLSGRGRLLARFSWFGESRRNGTPLQTNNTRIRHSVFGADWRSPAAGAFSVRAYGSDQVFNQIFSAVAPDRNSEDLTRSQRVPAQQVGVSIQWSRSAGGRQTLVAGFEAHEVRGHSDELVFSRGVPISNVDAGGRQDSFAFFAEDIFSLTPRWLFTPAVRIDRWRNRDATSKTQRLGSTTPAMVTTFPDRTETALSPQLSLLYRLSPNAWVSGSAYRAFRAPTLNELYRSFRVGDIATLANDKLRAERLTGGELGASLTAFNRRLSVRGNFFWSVIVRPVANVTLNTTSGLITRQRQNLGRTQSRGVEAEAEARLSERVVIAGGYQFADATVLSFPANRASEGLVIPQVPRHQFTLQARYSKPSHWTVALQGRVSGAQFEDDRNELKLDRYFTLDALLARAITSSLEMFAAAENLFNQRYAIGRTPVRTIGPPLLVNFGLRLRLGLR
jgi:outer membrane receptor protein involved in Fe transport